MLVRAKPGSAQADAAYALARRWESQAVSGLVFFHGPAVAHGAVDAGSGFASLQSDCLDLRVCSAGWRRLNAGSLDLPFAEGSLLQFWATALQANEVRSFGALSDG